MNKDKKEQTSESKKREIEELLLLTAWKRL